MPCGSAPSSAIVSASRGTSGLQTRRPPGRRSTVPSRHSSKCTGRNPASGSCTSPTGNDCRSGSASPADGIEVGFLAGQLAVVLSERFGLPYGPELLFRLEVMVEMAAAVLSRGFQSNVLGDERYIAEARRVIEAYLAGYYGEDLEQDGAGVPVLESAE
ncbi:hypothetical protein [Cryobacterium breve]|uniref:hypothetical protein n=1 Tax=Cryobacterium breve TaxID=1259258 RepID=UPI00248D3687|nr:hypothetical protein [Cryobacterium breve]